MQDVGSAKYVVSFHNGIKVHKDGSKFFDVKIVKNKKDLKLVTNNLLANGYKKG